MRLTRVYSNGEKRVLNSEDPYFATQYEGVQGNPRAWFEFNSTMRFGCALFIDGKCAYRGYLTPEECTAIEAEEQRILAPALI